MHIINKVGKKVSPLFAGVILLGACSGTDSQVSAQEGFAALNGTVPDGVALPVREVRQVVEVIEQTIEDSASEEPVKERMEAAAEPQKETVAESAKKANKKRGTARRAAKKNKPKKRR